MVPLEPLMRLPQPGVPGGFGVVPAGLGDPVVVGLVSSDAGHQVFMVLDLLRLPAQEPGVGIQPARVSVQNGQTVVIGGLMEDQKTSTVSKVPFLGDIPYVGELFKRTINSKRKTELLIFLTPHVASRPDMLESMGDEEVGTSTLVPNAVQSGAFQQHQAGLNAGAREIPLTTRPAEELPPEIIEEQQRQGGRGRRGGRHVQSFPAAARHQKTSSSRPAGSSHHQRECGTSTCCTPP